MTKKLKPLEEWLKQADYDLKTAESLFKTKRYIYAVFMCHLSVEKGLKGLYTKYLRQTPPKTHNLLYLIEKISLNVPIELYDFIFDLNRASVPTRYPDDLKRMMKDYKKSISRDILKKSKEVLKWLKTKL
jgi:HEPN domain-containing protein